MNEARTHTQHRLAGRTIRYLACATLIAALAVLTPLSEQVAAASTVTVVMSRLDNPRVELALQRALPVAQARSMPILPRRLDQYAT